MMPYLIYDVLELCSFNWADSVCRMAKCTLCCNHVLSLQRHLVMTESKVLVELIWEKFLNIYKCHPFIVMEDRILFLLSL